MGEVRYEGKNFWLGESNCVITTPKLACDSAYQKDIYDLI